LLRGSRREDEGAARGRALAERGLPDRSAERLEGHRAEVEEAERAVDREVVVEQRHTEPRGDLGADGVLTRGGRAEQEHHHERRCRLGHRVV